MRDYDAIKKEFWVYKGVSALLAGAVVICGLHHKYSGRYVFALRIRDGIPRVFRNAKLLNQFLSPQESRELLARLEGWFWQYGKDLSAPKGASQVRDLAIASNPGKA